MFTATLFINAPNWKPECNFTGESVNDVFCIHIMNYYSTIKNNKLLTLTATCMKLGGIMLCERSQSQKVKYLRFNYVTFYRQSYSKAEQISGC